MIAGVPVGRMLLILLLGCLMIPVPPSMDIRGRSETYPLDGPAWSLFFEYIANICYALVLRRLSKLLLGALAVVAACFTVRLAVTQDDMIGGWALDGEQLGVGFTRLAIRLSPDCCCRASESRSVCAALSGFAVSASSPCWPCRIWGRTACG